MFGKDKTKREELEGLHDSVYDGFSKLNNKVNSLSWIEEFLKTHTKRQLQMLRRDTKAIEKSIAKLRKSVERIK